MLDPSALRAHVKQIEEDGYAIVEDAVEADLVDALCRDLERLEGELAIVPADNDFEGRSTVRIYNLLAQGELYQRIPVHENVLAVVEKVLDPGCLVSSLSSIAIGPGETAQPIHSDDQLIPLPKPHPPTVCNTMWALTDFTDENGATRLVPGSHVRDRSPDYGHPYETIPAEMAKGSVLVWHGSLWHGGGANRTAERRVRVAVTAMGGEDAIDLARQRAAARREGDRPAIFTRYAYRRIARAGAGGGERAGATARDGEERED